jgi:hypothetical protein
LAGEEPFAELSCGRYVTVVRRGGTHWLNSQQ